MSDATLYDKLGGKDAVDDAEPICDAKVRAEHRTKHFFDGVDTARQRGKQKSALAYAFGGPVKYDGKDMREAHKHLDLNEEHFNAVAENLVETLKELNVPQELIDEVVTIAASTHDDVLNL